MLGVSIADSGADFGSLPELKNDQIKQKKCNSVVRDMKGLIGVRLDRNLEPISIDGEAEEITSYSKEDFLSGRIKWKEIVTPEDFAHYR
jgi:hypothetical protein